MPYYDYTDEFGELITNTETIIKNQEAINTKLEVLHNGLSLIIFSVIFYITLTTCRRLFGNR